MMSLSLSASLGYLQFLSPRPFAGAAVRYSDLLAGHPVQCQWMDGQYQMQLSFHSRTRLVRLEAIVFAQREDALLETDGLPDGSQCICECSAGEYLQPTSQHQSDGLPPSHWRTDCNCSNWRGTTVAGGRRGWHCPTFRWRAIASSISIDCNR